MGVWVGGWVDMCVWKRKGEISRKQSCRLKDDKTEKAQVVGLYIWVETYRRSAGTNIITCSRYMFFVTR